MQGILGQLSSTCSLPRQPPTLGIHSYSLVHNVSQPRYLPSIFGVHGVPGAMAVIHKHAKGDSSNMQTLTEKDVATLLRCSVACLRRMRREGRGPRWTRIGRLVRYPELWLQDYLNSSSN